MDPTRFDAFARMLVSATTRRDMALLLLGAGFAGFNRDAHARNKKRTSRQKSARGQRRPKSDGEPTRRNGKNGAERSIAVESAGCCATGNCAPSKGKNLSHCCYGGQNLTGQNVSGANLGGASFAGATLTNANLQGANLGNACFVDADLRGMRANGSTNWGGAILCRTRTDRGVDNSGCALGTPCCPTCDAQHPCAGGELCCNGRCVRGNCCDNGEQGPCADGQLCCGNTCVAGECCQAADCPNQTCRRRACTANRCTYRPIVGAPGPRCQTVCCEGDGGDPVCCTGTAAQCDSRGRCCTPERCCIPETKNQTCGVGTANPKCGEVTNNCGARIDCGRCADKTCQVANCSGQTNTCIYESTVGGPGTGCQTVCCRSEAGEPVCCDAGVPICLENGRCGCGRDAECGADEKCCGGNCIARRRCCDGGRPDVCAGGLHCCTIAGSGLCLECCEFGHCPRGETCQGGTCRPATTFERVRAVVANFFGVDESTITMETDFARDLDADSLDALELVLELEREFEITITEEDFENIRTVGDAVRAIDEHMG